MNEEQKFIKLFSVLKSTRPPERLLASVLERVTTAPVQRYSWWWSIQTLIPIATFGLMLAVGLWTKHSPDVSSEILAYQYENEQIGVMIQADYLLDSYQ